MPWSQTLAISPDLSGIRPASGIALLPASIRKKSTRGASRISSAAFGPNQCVHDKDGSVDHDERLSLSGVAPGRYDINIGYTDGRVCRVNNVTLDASKVFSIEDKDLTSCTK